jgi:hypothetical protein
MEATLLLTFLGYAAAPAATGVINLEPHFTQISERGVVVPPQAGQNTVPVSGLAPQDIQYSLLGVISLPQFLQYMPLTLFNIFIFM